jgi:hypothetical protein
VPWATAGEGSALCTARCATPPSKRRRRPEGCAISGESPGGSGSKRQQLLAVGEAVPGVEEASLSRDGRPEETCA